MPLKIKLKVNPAKSAAAHAEPEASEPRPLPRLKIKHGATKTEPVNGVNKSRPPKEKLKKLKLSLGRPGHAAAAAASPGSMEAGVATQAPPKRVPKVRIKPTRVPGEGYDSEAPDVEDDPLVEQAIAVRFLNDANLDFLHSAADTGDFSNVNIKWITRDKAVVNVNLTLYSARLIDLPTLTELYKTVDKKNIFKTIDVSQILLVLRTINPKHLNMDADFEVPEEHTYTHPLYRLLVHKEIRPSRTAYRHGLLNSFEDVYRRFRPKKTNHRLMTDVELRVDEIVRRDAEAQESHYEYVNPKLQPQRLPEGRPQEQLARSASATSAAHANSDVHAGIELEDEDEDEDDQMALDLEADLDNALEQELADALDSTSNTAAATVLMKSEYNNDDDELDECEATGANDDDEGDDDEDDDDDDDDEEDDDIKQDNSRAKKLEEEIADLQSAAEKQKVLLATASYKMMRMKFQAAYNNLKSQLDSKKRELAKIREQQLKQQAPGRMVASARRNEEDDEADDDEDDEDDAEDEEPDKQSEPTAFAGEGELQEDAYEERLFGKEENGNDEATKNDYDEDNYDDFQGLF